MFFNFEQWLTDFYVGLITSLANFVAQVVKTVFIADSVTITGQQSTADLNVIEQVGTIVLVLALPLTIAAVVWQIVRSNAEGRVSGVFRAILGGVLMVVLSRFAFWYGPVLITGFDQLTMQLIDTFNAAPGGITHGLLESFGLKYDEAEDAWKLKNDGEIPHPTWMAVGTAAGGIPLIPIVLLIILAIGGFLVMLMLGFRRWALIVMLAMAPLALMFLPAEKASKGIALKWLQIVVALLAAKPLAAIIMAVTARLLAATGDVSLLMLVVGMISFMIAAVAPLIAMKFFGFMSAEIGTAYAQAAGEGALRGGARGAMSTASQAQMATSSLRRGQRGGGGSPAPISGAAPRTAAAQTVGTSGGAKAATTAAAGKGAAAASGPAAPVVAAATTLASKKPRRG